MLVGVRPPARIKDNLKWEERCFGYLNLTNLNDLGRRKDESRIDDNLTSIHQPSRFRPVTSFSRPSTHPLAFPIALTLINERINQNKMMVTWSPLLPSFASTRTKALVTGMPTQRANSIGSSPCNCTISSCTLRTYSRTTSTVAFRIRPLGRSRGRSRLIGRAWVMNHGVISIPIPDSDLV